MNKISNPTSILFKFFGIVLFLMTIVSCWGADHDELKPYKDANRTVIGLILADNSLDSFSNDDIQEMIDGMQNSSIDWDRNNVLLFVDKHNAAPMILRLHKKGKNSKVIRDTIFSYTKESIADIPNIHFPESSSTESMCEDALKRIITNYSAKSYGLILWSHADGWIPAEDYIAPAFLTRKFGYDANTGTNPSVKWLDNYELKSIIKTSCSYMTNDDKKYDFIYADACQMANNATVYDFKDYCHYFVGSVAEIPGPGGYYTTQLPAMFDTSDPAIAVAKAYDEHYNREWHWTPNAGVQISVIKMSELENLAAVTESFIEKPEIAASIISLDWSTINHFDRRRSEKDETIYYDFKQVMENVLTSDQLVTWQKALDAAIVLNIIPEKIYSSITRRVFDANPCCGLAAYFPNASTYSKWNTYFQTYSWYKAAGMNYVQEQIQ